MKQIGQRAKPNLEVLAEVLDSVRIPALATQ
jgi:hypothetical protein